MMQKKDVADLTDMTLYSKMNERKWLFSGLYDLMFISFK